MAAEVLKEDLEVIEPRWRPCGGEGRIGRNEACARRHAQGGLESGVIVRRIAKPMVGERLASRREHLGTHPTASLPLICAPLESDAGVLERALDLGHLGIRAAEHGDALLGQLARVLQQCELIGDGVHFGGACAARGEPRLALAAHARRAEQRQLLTQRGGLDEALGQLDDAHAATVVGGQRELLGAVP